MACVASWTCRVLGKVRDDAKTSLQEAVEAFLEGCEILGTLVEVLEESGFYLNDGKWQLRERITVSEVATV